MVGFVVGGGVGAAAAVVEGRMGIGSEGLAWLVKVVHVKEG